jgi:hypothetical protein
LIRQQIAILASHRVQKGVHGRRNIRRDDEAPCPAPLHQGDEARRHARGLEDGPAWAGASAT